MKRGRFQRYRKKDGTISYVVDTRDAGGKHIRRAFSTLDRAKEFHERISSQRRRVRDGLESLIEEVRLGEFADEWLETRRDTGVVTQGTYVTEEQRMRMYVKPKAGHLILSRITTPFWERLLADTMRTRKLSAATRDRIRALVSAMYRDAIRLGCAAHNPIAVIPKLEDRKAEKWKVWRKHEDCLAYLEAARGYQSAWFYPYVCIAIQTGAREGEILALRWDEDVSFEQGAIHIWQTYERDSETIVPRTKGKAPRYVGINESLKRVLAEYRASLPEKRAKRGALLFERSDAIGKPQDPRRVRKIHEKVCGRAGVERIRFHDIRHLYGTLFMQASGNQYVLQKVLGHKTLKMTERYSHVDPKFLQSHAGVVEFPPVSRPDATRKPQKSKKLRIIK